MTVAVSYNYVMVTNFYGCGVLLEDNKSEGCTLCFLDGIGGDMIRRCMLAIIPMCHECVCVDVHNYDVMRLTS